MSPYRGQHVQVCMGRGENQQAMEGSCAVSHSTLGTVCPVLAMALVAPWGGMAPAAGRSTQSTSKNGSMRMVAYTRLVSRNLRKRWRALGPLPANFGQHIRQTHRRHLRSLRLYAGFKFKDALWCMCAPLRQACAGCPLVSGVNGVPHGFT